MEKVSNACDLLGLFSHQSFQNYYYFNWYILNIVPVSLLGSSCSLKSKTESDHLKGLKLSDAESDEDITYVQDVKAEPHRQSLTLPASFLTGVCVGTRQEDSTPGRTCIGNLQQRKGQAPKHRRRK